MSDSTNVERWAIISEKFKKLIEKGGDDRLLNHRIAVNLRAELASSCGCDEASTYFYKFEHGHVPEYDRYERVSDALDAVTSTEVGVTIGLGIELSMAPDALPKTVIVWPIEVTRDGSEVTLTSPMMHEPVSFSAKDGSKFAAAIKAAAEQMYHKICDAMDFWIEGGRLPKPIGFG